MSINTPALIVISLNLQTKYSPEAVAVVIKGELDRIRSQLRSGTCKGCYNSTFVQPAGLTPLQLYHGDEDFLRAEEEPVEKWGIKNAFGGFAGLGVLLNSPETEESRLQHAVEVGLKDFQLFMQLQV